MKRSGWIAVVAGSLLCLLTHDAPAQVNDRLEEALDATMNLQFENTHVRVVCRFLGEEYGITILIDENVLTPPGHKISKPYVTNGYIQNIDLTNVTMREAFDTILTPLGLAYTAKERYVWVTTPERINTKPYSDMETQIFEVPGSKTTETTTSAFGEPNLIVLLRKVVPMVIDPDTGELLSYMRYNLVTSQLVVKNTSNNLDTVQQLLDLISDGSQPTQQQNAKL